MQAWPRDVEQVNSTICSRLKIYLPAKQDQLNVSANCKDVDSALKIVVEDSELPAEHGSEVSYRCKRKHVNVGQNVRAFCRDGNITFSGGDSSSPCFKTGTKPYQYILPNILLRDKFVYIDDNCFT